MFYSLTGIPLCLQSKSFRYFRKILKIRNALSSFSVLFEDLEAPRKRFPFQTPASDFDTAPPTASVWHLLSHHPQSPTPRSKHLFANILPDPPVWDRPWASKYVQWTRNMIRDSRINRVMSTPEAGTPPLCTQTPTHTPNTAPGASLSPDLPVLEPLISGHEGSSKLESKQSLGRFSDQGCYPTANRLYPLVNRKCN